MDEKSTIYKSSPIDWLDCSDGKKIPVFSSSDAYTENYDRISEDHLAHFDRTGANPFISEDLWQESEANTLQLVRKYAKDGASILDVGCGTGRLLGMLPGYRRYGLDISAAYLRRATQTGAEVCLAKVEDMPYRDRLFDVVVCTDVLEHVLDLNFALRQILCTLKDEGVMIVRVPYKEDLSVYLSPEFPYSLAHLRTFDEVNLRLIFEKIFHGRLIEERLGPYVIGSQYLRCPNKSALLGKALRALFRLIGLLSLRGKNWLVRKCFNPVEINVVFKKTGSLN